MQNSDEICHPAVGGPRLASECKREGNGVSLSDITVVVHHNVMDPKVGMYRE
jgi:hypothetical protein